MCADRLQRVHVLVDRPVSGYAAQDAPEAAIVELLPCHELCGIEFVDCVLSDDGGRRIFHLVAPDVETVRRVLRRATS